MASKFAFPTQGDSGGASDIPPGTGYVYQDPPGTFGNLASIPGSDLDAGSVANSKLQYSSVTLTQPVAGLTITSSVALGGTATFALADDLAGIEAITGTGLVQRTAANTYSTTTVPAISGANFSSATIDVGSLAFSATSRMLPSTSLALANVMITGNGTSWTNTTSAGANYIMTSGATVASWQNSLTGITINGSTNTITNLTTSMLASGFNLAATQGGTGQTTYTTAVNRLPGPEVTSLLKDYDRTFNRDLVDEDGQPVLDESGKVRRVSRASEIQEALYQSVRRFLTANPGTTSIDPLRFREYLDTSSDETQSHEYVVQLADFVSRLELLGLTPRELALSKNVLLAPVRPRGIATIQQFEAVIRGSEMATTGN